MNKKELRVFLSGLGLALAVLCIAAAATTYKSMIIQNDLIVSGNAYLHGTLSNNITGSAAAADWSTNFGGTVIDGLTTLGAATANITNLVMLRPITAVIDGGGAAITTGYKTWTMITNGGTIKAIVLSADQVTGLGINVWRTNAAGYPPTAAGKISGAATPVLTATNWTRDTTLTGWTTLLNAGDWIGFNVESNTTATKAVLQIFYQ